MDFQNDTICAISTPAGVGGIAVCRISGPEAIAIASHRWKGRPLDRVESHTAHFGEVLDADGNPLDQCVATVFRAPRSFTGEDVVEFSVHGSRYVQSALLRSLIAAGSRMAEAGEFTRRAFASGKMDLAEAEAVADVIASESRAAHRIALNQMKGGFSRRLSELRARLVDLVALMELELDFSEEDVEFASREKLLDIARQIESEVGRLHGSFAAGSAIKNGIPVAIVGDTNAGKSSLLNAILGDDRAIVSNIHGTTRDTIEETVNIGDYQFRFIDTAGIRDTTDTIERIGVERSIEALNRARIVLLVCDITVPVNRQLLDIVAETTAQGTTAFIVANKIDAGDLSAFRKTLTDASLPILPISSKNGEGLDKLKMRISEAVAAECCAEGDILVTNLRHAEALGAARQSIARVIDGLRASLPGDLVSQDIRETLHHLAAITGEIPSTEILSTIFSRFCVGK